MKLPFDNFNSDYRLRGRHIVGAVIVTVMLYLIFPVFYTYYVDTAPSSTWLPVWVFILLSPVIWIGFVSWLVISLKILSAFGWASPYSALTQALLASGILWLLIVASTSTAGAATNATAIFYAVLLVLLLAFRNIDRKRK